MIQGHGSIKERVWNLLDGLENRKTLRNVVKEELEVNTVECANSYTHTSEYEKIFHSPEILSLDSIRIFFTP